MYNRIQKVQKQLFRRPKRCGSGGRHSNKAALTHIVLTSDRTDWKKRTESNRQKAAPRVSVAVDFKAQCSFLWNPDVMQAKRHLINPPLRRFKCIMWAVLSKSLQKDCMLSANNNQLLMGLFSHKITNIYQTVQPGWVRQWWNSDMWCTASSLKFPTLLLVHYPP